MTTLTLVQPGPERCARGCPAWGECPWDGQALCWGCVNLELDILAAAASAGYDVTVCRSTGRPEAGGDWRDERNRRRMDRVTDRVAFMDKLEEGFHGQAS
jgi:hypothetical protein